MMPRARPIVFAGAVLVMIGTIGPLAAPAPPTGGAVGQTAQDPPPPYAAQQRPPGDPEVIERGRALYEISCRSCHGLDLRGGDLGGPNLLRSQLVLADLEGELIGPVILNGRSTPGLGTMPAQPLAADDVVAVIAYIHDILSTGTRQGGPPPGEAVELDILVGDAAAGQTYFAARCASCHSPTGDLQGIGGRFAEEQELQNSWVRGGAARAERPPVTVTVVQPSGERVEGRLDRLDDFIVALTQSDGRQRSFSRRGDVPRVEVSDPLTAHTELLRVYSDTDIHDITAYLVTLQ